jgi:hypothetical protein
VPDIHVPKLDDEHGSGKSIFKLVIDKALGERRPSR